MSYPGHYSISPEEKHFPGSRREPLPGPDVGCTFLVLPAAGCRNLCFEHCYGLGGFTLIWAVNLQVRWCWGGVTFRNHIALEWQQLWFLILLITAVHYYFIYSDTSVVANTGSSSAFYTYWEVFSTVQDLSCLDIMKCNTLFSRIQKFSPQQPAQFNLNCDRD